MREVKINNLDGQVKTEYFLSKEEANEFQFRAESTTGHLMAVENIVNGYGKIVYRVRDID